MGEALAVGVVVVVIEVAAAVVIDIDKRVCVSAQIEESIRDEKYIDGLETYQWVALCDVSIDAQNDHLPKRVCSKNMAN